MTLLPSSNDSCPMCNGIKTNGHTTYTADNGTGVVVIRNVPARICTQCGEEWLEDSIVQKIEAILQDSGNRHAQVEVLAM